MVIFLKYKGGKSMHKNSKLKRWVITGFFFLLIFQIAFTSVYAADTQSIFTPYTKVTLENGLTVIIKEVHSSPNAAIDICVATGAKNESPDEAGISHFLEHMLFKGTTRRKAGEIAREIQSIGGVLNGQTSMDTTHYYVVVPSVYIDLALDTEMDAMMYSAFDPGEIERERNVVTEEIRLSQDNTQSWLSYLALQKIYDGTPYANNVLGTPDTLKNINQDTFLKYYHKYYVPNNMVLTVVGDVNTNDILSEIKLLVGDFIPNKLEPSENVKMPKLTDISRFEIQKDIRQTYLYFGFPAPPMNSKDSTAIEMLRIILGGCRSAKLNELEWKKQLVSSISADYSTYKDIGLFGIYVETQNATPTIEEEVRSALRQIINNGVSDAELATAKTLLRTRYAFTAENSFQLASMMSRFEIYGSVEDAVSYEKNMQEVTKDDLQQAAKKYLDPDRFVLITLKPKEAKEL
jgi:zinc protease